VLSVTLLILCVTDFVSTIKQNVSIDLRKKFLRFFNEMVGLDLAPFRVMVENRCCRSKKNVLPQHLTF